jgi:hypothetical protein
MGSALKSLIETTAVRLDVEQIQLVSDSKLVSSVEKGLKGA